MTDLRLALVVPDYSKRGYSMYRGGRLTKRIAAGEIDLVVFPEAAETRRATEPLVVSEALAQELGAPVLVGVSLADEKNRYFEAAAYCNPNPRKGETKHHLYLKHSTAERLAYEWPEYRGADDSMFEPIAIRGRRLGVLICHDMFFGLIPHQLYRRGADAVVNLTGGHVNERKWTTVLRARSREFHGEYYCTMGWNPERESGNSFEAAYRDGKLVQPDIDDIPDGSGGYAVYTAGRSTAVVDDDEQDFSDKIYDTVRLSLDGSTESADLALASNGTVNGQSVLGWRDFTTRGGRARVLVRSIHELADVSVLYRSMSRDKSAMHIAIYVSDEEVDPSWAMDLMRLRAIEHRIAVAVRARNLQAVVKTNRYKNIQRFPARNGIYGLDDSFMDGTWSTASSNPKLGIAEKFFPRYLELLGSS